MKVKFSELAPGACYLHGKKGSVKKKVDSDRYVALGAGGKVRKRKEWRDPDVDLIPCPLRLIGIGLRGHPAAIVEIGSSHARERRCR